MTIPRVLFDRFESSPWQVAYEVRHGEGWRTWTWREVETVVRELCAGLIARGVGLGGHGAVLAGTRLEWILADFAVLCAGASTTTVYPSSTAEECAYILEDAGVEVVFVESAAQRAKVPASIETVVCIEGEAPDSLSWRELRELGRAWLDEHGLDAWKTSAERLTPDDLATLIYTSGTTGRPKGVRLVHDCWMAQVDALSSVIEAQRLPDDKLFLWLPLAHVYGKVLQLGGLKYGVPCAIDGNIERLADNLAATRPTYVPAVPRVFEKMHNRILTQVSERGPRVERVFRWASAIGSEVSERRRSGRRVPLGLQLKHAIADRLVFTNLRAAFGGRIRAWLSGSAPLSKELHHFFDGAGMLILEGYGLTESTAVATANLPDAVRLGTVGRVGEGTEVRIQDGEVQLRGRIIMRGYHNLPEATEAAFDNGWFRTGDLGSIDADGFLSITGRIKELLVTSGGKNIAPAPIESAVKARCPRVQEVVMVGDRRNFCTALVTLDPEAAPAWAAALGRSTELSELAKDPDLRAEIEAAISEVNAELPSYATIKDFVVLPVAFSLESGELTPSQKVRRAVVMERFEYHVEPFYAGAVRR